MGFIREPVGNVGIETRSSSFIITHTAEWQGSGGYDSIEIGYEDLPDLLEALGDMIRSIPTRTPSTEGWHDCDLVWLVAGE